MSNSKSVCRKCYTGFMYISENYSQLCSICNAGEKNGTHYGMDKNTYENPSQPSHRMPPPTQTGDYIKKLFFESFLKNVHVQSKVQSVKPIHFVDEKLLDQPFECLINEYNKRYSKASEDLSLIHI